MSEQNEVLPENLGAGIRPRPWTYSQDFLGNIVLTNRLKAHIFLL
jgi:hypothetical protein